MKAISLWQPWATLIAIGAKRVETRPWLTGYRGPLIIHAAQHWTKQIAELTSAPGPIRDALVAAGFSMAANRFGLPFGALVCVTTLENCKASLHGPVDVGGRH